MYKHTQIGRVTLAVLAAVLLIEFFAFRFIDESAMIGFILLAVLILVGLLFGALTVSLDAEYIKISFGIGVVKKKYPLAPIVRYEEVKNKWWYGFGIRLTPHGWLYNVSGLQAVEIEFENGKKIRIGTDEPQTLIQAIREVKG